VSSTALIAVGGNALIRSGEKGTAEQQSLNLQRTAAAIVQLAKRGYRMVITHGNGPQVGAALLRTERAADQVYPLSLDVCDACTQGEIGYQFELALSNELTRAGLDQPIVTVVTQCVVSQADPAFSRPTKFIGPHFTADEARKHAEKLGWTVARDSNRGYRRTVASPEPLDIVELIPIRGLVESRALVIAAGGGGIPVVRTPEGLRGCEAVIDKDRASALLASQLGLELLIICTDTDYVYLDYGTLMQRQIHIAMAAEMEAFHKAGHFPPGSMGPKIEAALQFLGNGGSRVVITNQENLAEAVAGNCGTQILPHPISRSAPGKATDLQVRIH
jgi:carbamate kinase